MTLSLRAAHPEKSGPRVTTYAEWLRLWESTLYTSENRIQELQNRISNQPLLSVVVVVINHRDIANLSSTLESLTRQRYGSFELVAVSTDELLATTRETVRKQFSADADRVMLRTDTAEFKLASNDAAQRATGEYLLVLHPGDQLHTHALLEIAIALNQQEGIDLLYCDEDTITGAGVRTDPIFKPGFDPEMLLTHNYIGRIICIRTALFRALGGFRTNYPGAETWDLLLRIQEQSIREQSPVPAIRHLAKPLFHRGLTTTSKSNAKQTVDIQKALLKDYLHRNAIDAAVEPGIVTGTWRVRYSRRTATAALIVRSSDGPYQAAQLACLATPAKTVIYESVGNFLYQVPLKDALHAPEQVISISELPVDVLVFINRPVETLNHDFLDELVANAMRPECGLVTGIALNARHEVAQAGYLLLRGEPVDIFANRRYPLSNEPSQFNVAHYINDTQGSFFAVRRETIADIGGLGTFDGGNTTHFLGRLVEHSMASGLHMLFTPYAVATLVGSGNHSPRHWVPSRPPQYAELNPNLLNFADPVAASRSSMRRTVTMSGC